MLNLLNSLENNPKVPFQLRRYRPSLTIQSEPKNQLTRQHTIQDLLNFKLSGMSSNIPPTQSIIQRKLSIRPSLKLTKITPFVTESGDNCTPIIKRTISLENTKKVDFHPSVLVIYSENGIKKREKLIDEFRVKRKGTRKNCIIIQKK
ncbi:unnamed protein product [Paramecium primaurelia]|uniref:Uncharacterized protein n=1 Tax=Paramecium primaurelia TaxID=5886 RepID=A0A8S1JR31_PARPR|nr:unnamed protein product [Paramecium primaurelia]